MGDCDFYMADPEKNPWAVVARYSEIGFIIPAAVLLGYFLGRVADYYLHTHWIYLAGLLFGAVMGFVQMIRRATASAREKDE
jgi:F0F1-type ATP synthase assembly protein I